MTYEKNDFQKQLLIDAFRHSILNEHEILCLTSHIQRYCEYSDWLQFEHQEQNDEEDIISFTDKIVALYSLILKVIHLADHDSCAILASSIFAANCRICLYRFLYSNSHIQDVKHLFNRFLTIKSIPVVQQVYQAILADMTSNFNVLLQALQQKAIVIGSETLSFPTTTDLNEDDAEAALIFDCSALC
ncbi:unnamed protein product [Rotaria sordida]|uniref:Uncharacterized protein n=1 Tax=Rotaria sordida TaxID=392033 RepID=A0A819U3I8_9BILA|nr:unnamed protein product [Rotaria sordida]CAF4087848.1 unnamed protein product [Rotaria sordida]